MHTQDRDTYKLTEKRIEFISKNFTDLTPIDEKKEKQITLMMMMMKLRMKR